MKGTTVAHNSLISIIIPTLNNEDSISDCLAHLIAFGRGSEIILVDGGSEDSTVAIAQDYPVRIYAGNAGRASRMNYGAGRATRDILYFLDPETIPPTDFVEGIYNCFLEGNVGGCFSMRFVNGKKLTTIKKYMSRLKITWTGGGDQSLFLFARTFEYLGGYNESLEIMEDFDLVDRMRRLGKFHVHPGEISVRPQKYQSVSYLKVQLANVFVYQMYRIGYQQEILKRTWSRMLEKS